MTVHKIESDEHWRDLRSRHIGASDAAALFNLSPYKTHYSFFMEFTGRAPAPVIEEDCYSRTLPPPLQRRCGEGARIS